VTKTEFVYVVYIAAEQQRVFDALMKPEFTRHYWQHENATDWKPGSRWEHRNLDTGKIDVLGKIVLVEPPTKMIWTWASPKDEANPEAYSRVTFDLDQVDGMVRLKVTHDELDTDSGMLKGISNGWPRVLSSLKSYLETGKPLPPWSKAKS
jgi:uncharacterized protein YndB with AHSA1/START domain